jgi:hypothetical protein
MVQAATVVLVLLVAAVAGDAPADAAFGPNLIANGSFELPTATAGPVAPPFGTCGASTPVNGDGFSVEASEGCWTALAPPGAIHVDNVAAKGGKQSVVVAPPPQQLAWLMQAVAADQGQYRLQFKSSPEGTVDPISVVVWAVSASVVTQTSLVTFGPDGYTVNGTAVRTWGTTKLDLTAPAGTDHLVVCLCGVSQVSPAFPIPPGGIFPNGHWGSARFDAVTLKKQL